MMGQFHDKAFPGEDSGYRSARNELLAAEIELRGQIEKVAALRRTLPTGGLAQNYVFQEGASDLEDRHAVTDIALVDLFAPGKDTLVIYSFMYAPDAENPCPMCTSMLDSLNGASRQLGDRINLAVVAKSPVQKTRDWARQRGWSNLRLLSSENNTYNVDYFAEDEAGSQHPCLNVFTKSDDGSIHHFYASEMFFAGSPDGMHARHVDMIWPLWNVLDLTPEGRGTDWYPSIA